MHDGFLGFWQKWRCMRIGETIMISIPLKRDYIRRRKANKGGWLKKNWNNWKKLGKEWKQRKGV